MFRVFSSRWGFRFRAKNDQATISELLMSVNRRVLLLLEDFEVHHPIIKPGYSPPATPHFRPRSWHVDQHRKHSVTIHGASHEWELSVQVIFNPGILPGIAYSSPLALLLHLSPSCSILSTSALALASASTSLRASSLRSRSISFPLALLILAGSDPVSSPPLVFFFLGHKLGNSIC